MSDFAWSGPVMRALMGLALIAGACADGAEDGGTSGGRSGGAGGSLSGGAEPGGAARVVGGASASGGVATGGVVAGSSAIGGAATGGVVGGGSATGGAATGGALTGGAQTGGRVTGGSGTGGVRTGGAATGGKVSGGTTSGGAGTGGKAPGGTTSGGGGTGGSSIRPRLELVRAGVLDDAAMLMNDGDYGRYINDISYVQNQIASDGARQYAAWYHSTGANQGRVAVARRDVSSATWARVELSNATLTSDNTHRNVSLGLAPGDGSLHVAFGMHADPLAVRSSAAQLAGAAASTWASATFSVASFPAAAPYLKATYPQFLTLPDESLRLWFRSGVSGDGDFVVLPYDPGARKWGTPTTFIGRGGRWSFTDPAGRVIQSTSRSAYPNGFHVGSNGTIHVSWVWRERPSNLPAGKSYLANHGLYYAQSRDGGRTWRLSNGSAAPLPITVETPGAEVWSLPPGLGAINSQAQVIDGQGRFHVVMSQRDTLGDPYSFGNDHFHHYLRAANGTWSHRTLTLRGGGRPRLLVDANDDLYLLYQSGGRLTVAIATAHTGWSDFEVEFDYGSICSDVEGDARYAVSRGLLTLQGQACAPAGAVSSKFYALDVRVVR